MAIVGGGSSALFYLCLFLCITTFSQGLEQETPAEYRYPFIKPASSFSPPPASASSGAQGGGVRAYDYIIVGGGTAGCPLAATLSRNYTVLVLERGGTPFANSNVSFMENFHISLADTSATSASQMFVSTDGVYNSRARVLGGGSCINAGFYTRADQSFIKSVGWDPELVKESYPWVEDQIVHQPQPSEWQEAFTDGLLEVGVSPYNGFTYDHKEGTKVGGTIFDRFGRRHTSAELLASANPQNLHVLVYATVDKIMFHTNGKKPRAVGVMFRDEKGMRHRALLSRRPKSEIIVSCGAIGSPQLLLLSGVGPKAELEKLNISVVVDNELVGKGMADNPLNMIFVPTNGPVKQSLIQAVGITKQGVYIEASSGYGQKPDSIHWDHGIERTERSRRNLPYEAFMGGFILEKVAKPLSRGEITLKNTNIDDNPSITFNYFSHPADVARCVDGIRLVERLLKSKPFANFTKFDSRTEERLLNMSIRANVNLIPKHTNDTKSLEQFCKDTVTTIWHYHGGCQVGKVVDADYRVLGVGGVRVVDGSTFYDSPGTNPQATLMMMGRYMGVKILRDRLGKVAGV